MRFSFLMFILFFLFDVKGQSKDSLISAHNSILNKLHEVDSVIYYQCHVEDAVQQLSTTSGQKITGKPQKYAITEKYILKKIQNSFVIDYYTSSFTIFPNRKFSGLKIREKGYWNFKKEKTIILNQQGLKILLAIEKIGKEAIEYDYAITKHNTNQLIIKKRKDFKQLVIDGNFILSALLF